jgi:hypothetical protein
MMHNKYKLEEKMELKNLGIRAFSIERHLKEIGIKISHKRIHFERIMNNNGGYE